MLQNRRSAKDVSSSDSDAVDEWINSIKSKEKNDKEVKCRMHIGRNVVDFQIDMGATCNLLPKTLAKVVQPYVGTLRMWNNTVSEPVGVCWSHHEPKEFEKVQC